MIKRLFFTSLICVSVSANDSKVTVTQEGINYEKSEDIELRSENLEISLSEIKVDYEFYNKSSKEKILTVGFPLPPSPFNLERKWDVFPEWDELYWSYATHDPKSYAFTTPLYNRLSHAPFVNFKNWVNGVEISVDSHLRVFRGQKDFKETLIKYNIPLSVTYLNGFEEQGALQRTPYYQKVLKKLKLLDDKGRADFQTQTIYTWKTEFAPRKITKTRHSYKPDVGFFSFSYEKNPKGLREVSTSYWEPYKTQALKNYKKLSLKDQKKIMAYLKAVESKEYSYLHVFEIRYILKTARNWKGPIQSFKLKIKVPQDRDAFVLGIGPLKRNGEFLTFESKNFIPQEDLSILFIERPLPLLPR